MNRNIHITSMDLERLNNMIEKAKYDATKEKLFYLNKLSSELRNATIVDSKDIPENIVTMNSLVRVLDLNYNEETLYTIVYPEDANISKNMLSILAPIGTALIGYSVGDIIEWDVPEGTIKLQIKEILYQPESFGNFQL